MNHRSYRTCLVWAVCALTLSFSAPPVRAQIAPLPPGQPAYGLTQGQWLEAYVQWYGSIPVSSSPWLSYDSDGTHAGVGQHGPVWFLSSQTRGTQYSSRTVTVPEGKAILAVATGFTATAVPGSKTDASLLNQAAADTSVALGQVTRFEVSLDGVPVGDLLPYRVHTDVFSIDLPPDNFFQQPVTAGKDNRLACAADEIVLLYPPLPVGTHVFSYLAEGIQDGQPWKTTRTVTVLVQKPNVPLP